MKTLSWCLAILLMFASCSKSDQRQPVVPDCESLQLGIKTNDAALVAAQINNLCENLQPTVTAADEYGQEQNLYLLVQRISMHCTIEASVMCYACIETLPVQSEIRIRFVENGITHSRVIDLICNDGNMLRFQGMHD